MSNLTKAIGTINAFVKISIDYKTYANLFSESKSFTKSFQLISEILIQQKAVRYVSYKFRCKVDVILWKIRRYARVRSCSVID